MAPLWFVLMVAAAVACLTATARKRIVAALACGVFFTLWMGSSPWAQGWLGP
jgi:hypothetical protein